MINLEKAKARSKIVSMVGGEAFQIDVDLIDPNPWNHNEMDPQDYDKLKLWVDKCFKENGHIALPIVVRPKKDRYQIIDGFHRWKATKDLGYKVIDSHTYKCDVKTAKLLTDALNYLRGRPNPTKAVDYVQSLIRDGVSLKEIASLTHYTDDSLNELIEMSDIDVEELNIRDADDESTDTEEEAREESWVEMKFSVPFAAAEVIEAEIARLSETMQGKNLRGRALEAMAVLSGQTPLDSVDSQETTTRVRIKGKKK